MQTMELKFEQQEEKMNQIIQYANYLAEQLDGAISYIETIGPEDNTYRDFRTTTQNNVNKFSGNNLDPENNLGF